VKAGARHILATVWGEQQGYVFRPRKLDGAWIEGAAQPWPVPEQELRFYNPTGSDLYWCPLVFSEAKRRAEYALPTRWLWADLDGAPPRQCALRPSVLWKTSGGVSSQAHHHALWLLNEEIPAREAAELSKAIAYATPGADRGGWDVTQVLRIPGSLNHKRTPPEPVVLLWAKRLVYRMIDVKSKYPPAPDREVVVPTTWPQVPQEVVDATFRTLPHGIQRLFQQDASRVDRSLALYRLAETLLAFDVQPDVAVHLLQRATVNKFSGRADEHVRLLSEVQRLTARNGAAHP
jgi:hypothetical protein